jgi:hypothetical protein
MAIPDLEGDLAERQKQGMWNDEISINLPPTVS